MPVVEEMRRFVNDAAAVGEAGEPLLAPSATRDNVWLPDVVQDEETAVFAGSLGGRRKG